jgi:hypothetical protein
LQHNRKKTAVKATNKIAPQKAEPILMCGVNSISAACLQANFSMKTVSLVAATGTKREPLALTCVTVYPE